VTSDHATGDLWGPTGVYTDIVDNGKGNLPGAQYYSTDHTNELVPLFAKGAGSELFATYADKIDLIRGAYIDNTEIFQVMNAQITAAPLPGSSMLMGSGTIVLVFIGLRRKIT
jgi:alkaline phosphatase